MCENNCTLERKAMIFNIQKYNIYDGPGVRTIVFFKGCPLRCKWCANPEGLVRKYQVMNKEDACASCGSCVAACPMGIHSINSEGKHVVNREIDCIGCRACEKACMKKAISIVGEMRGISELLEVIEEDEAFYQTSGGGVTLGGGEVTSQPEAALNLLMRCKQEGINTAIETCGYTSQENILKIAEYVDLFLYDIKHIDSDTHYQLTGVRNERILENLQALLERGYNVHIRMPLLKGVNDQEQDIKKTLEFLMPYKNLKNFKGIDLLPYHKLGVNKYKQLDMEYPMQGEFSLSEEDLDRLEKWVNEYDFPVTVVRH